MNASNDTISHHPRDVYDSAVAASSAHREMGAADENETTAEHSGTFRDAARDGLVCPNCGGALEGRKCKLFCQTPGCGYLVTCSEW